MEATLCRDLLSPQKDETAYYKCGMKPLPAPNVPGKPESARMDNAVRTIFSVSKRGVAKSEAQWKITRAGRRRRCEEIGLTRFPPILCLIHDCQDVSSAIVEYQYAVNLARKNPLMPVSFYRVVDCSIVDRILLLYLYRSKSAEKRQSEVTLRGCGLLNLQWNC